jgi:hypothetical protein
MTTIEAARKWEHGEGRPRRSRLHRVVSLLILVFLASVALNWTFSRALTPIAPDLSLRFIDAFAITLTLALFMVMLGVAWRTGAGRRQ